jgi:hypothetical protein
MAAKSLKIDSLELDLEKPVYHAGDGPARCAPVLGESYSCSLSPARRQYGVGEGHAAPARFGNVFLGGYAQPCREGDCVTINRV